MEYVYIILKFDGFNRAIMSVEGLEENANKLVEEFQARNSNPSNKYYKEKWGINK